MIASTSLLDQIGDCTPGAIRLQGSVIEQEGRVEICYDDVWGVICDEGWDKTDAHIACTQLGYPDLGTARKIFYYIILLFVHFVRTHCLLWIAVWRWKVSYSIL